ncbi:hypothetical protein [Paenibacillus alvei]|uniref:Uncharacterized protein n=1 Tax=Paenibacillus alvei TaxID=44250 RepID=A0AAP7A1W6_PAEAL|nr:hypothetical protein [Paenibacillus alvei]NOJ74119.1 hypothetical protein [Paenibacillus alvei]
MSTFQDVLRALNAAAMLQHAWLTSSKYRLIRHKNASNKFKTSYAGRFFAAVSNQENSSIVKEGVQLAY